MHDAQRISAPRAFNVSIKIAVSMVMCREPDNFNPFKGCSAPYFSLDAMSPGISFSETEMDFRPASAKPMSATLYGIFSISEVLTKSPVLK